MNKICPIRLSTGQPKECNGEWCAWYSRLEDECAVLVISRRLNDIAYRLADLNLDGMTIERED